MATQILYLHWRAVRMGLLPLMIAAFGVPLVAIQGLARPEGMPDGFYAALVLEMMGTRLALFPLLAAATGVVLALTSWSWDHETKHVYALSLPIARWRYALLKFGSGAVLALLPTAALLAGTYLAAASLTLPPLLQAYPAAVTVRFLLSTLLIYALLFAFAAGSIRTTIVVLTVFIVVLVGGNLVMDGVLSLAGRESPSAFSFTEWLLDRLTLWPGPFHVLTGNWAFIDV